MIRILLTTTFLFMALTTQSHAFNVCEDKFPLPEFNIDYLDGLQIDLGNIAKGIETHGKCIDSPVMVSSMSRTEQTPLYSVDLPKENQQLVKVIKGFASLLIINDKIDQYMSKDINKDVERICIRFKKVHVRAGDRLLEELVQDSGVEVKLVEKESCL